MLTVGPWKPRSWVAVGIPEMLWAILLVTRWGRHEALQVYRNVANYRGALSETTEREDITHSYFEQLVPERRHEVIGIIAMDAEAKRALRPLLLFDDLPSREMWAEAIRDEPPPEDWDALANAVARVLNHQSEEATDCRWARVIFQMVGTRKMKFIRSPEVEETVKGYLQYPHYGDLRRVRPSIRASEIGLDTSVDFASPWPEWFWNQCLRETPCIGWTDREPTPGIDVGTTLDRVSDAYRKVREHEQATRKTTAVDARHEAIFGSALYALRIVRELLGLGVSQGVLGRTGLRGLVELAITLAYLIHEDKPELWQSYRVYGAGQAKLAFLHLDRLEEDRSFVRLDTLRELANDDVWQEYLPINLGHWDRANLRALSERAGVKDAYDTYYAWTSTYLHGQWGAIRDSAFAICRNPLHRLHRISRPAGRTLEDVLPDASKLADMILAVVNQSYPGLDLKITASKGPASTESSSST
jgi:hypothetical protein